MIDNAHPCASTIYVKLQSRPFLPSLCIGIKIFKGLKNANGVFAHFNSIAQPFCLVTFVLASKAGELDRLLASTHFFRDSAIFCGLSDSGISSHTRIARTKCVEAVT